jgi:hypothetical protein
MMELRKTRFEEGRESKSVARKNPSYLGGGQRSDGGHMRLALSPCASVRRASRRGGVLLALIIKAALLQYTHVHD